MEAPEGSQIEGGEADQGPRGKQGFSSEDQELLQWGQRRFGLKLDSGEEVRVLQEQLMKLGHNLFADGLLGRQTLAALRDLRDAESAGTKTPNEAPPEPPESQSTKTGGADPADAAGGGAASSEPSDEEHELSTRTVALSDQAIASIEEDRLDFAPSVRAVTRFLLAEQTRAPLALAINARWGSGKTSFMNMLDRQLHAEAPGSGVAVATTWFNPWKHSQPEQVWAAFVANIARCIEDRLGPWQKFSFRLQRWWQKLRRHAGVGLVMRGIVAFSFLVLLVTLPLMDWSAFTAALKADSSASPLLTAAYQVMVDESGATGRLLGYLSWAAAVLLGITYAYSSLTRQLGLNLLEYLEKTDFRDKIGTLAQFEGEMRRLSEAVPAHLKIVVFVDDLDRCKGQVLGEIIEALQLADVSRSCIFVLGMDLGIVASVVETERQELAHSVDGSSSALEHGSGYKFLEKIIQARLSLPAFHAAQMERLVDAAMGDAESAADAEQAAGAAAMHAAGAESGAAATSPDKAAGGGLMGRLNPFRRQETPQDAPEIIAAARQYGSRHFRNPRRLKRFINGFRLQCYLARTRPEFARVGRLARFLVLAEKWPALLDHVLRSDTHLQDLRDGGRALSGSTGPVALGFDRLSVADRKRLFELIDGEDGADPIDYEDLVSLAEWYGFSYYPGLNSKD